MSYITPDVTSHKSDSMTASCDSDVGGICVEDFDTTAMLATFNFPRYYNKDLQKF